jgi:hypothetical protein
VSKRAIASPIDLSTPSPSFGTERNEDARTLSRGFFFFFFFFFCSARV